MKSQWLGLKQALQLPTSTYVVILWIILFVQGLILLGSGLITSS